MAAGKIAACFSHFLLLNDFPPPSRSLEQAITKAAWVRLFMAQPMSSSVKGVVSTDVSSNRLKHRKGVYIVD